MKVLLSPWLRAARCPPADGASDLADPGIDQLPNPAITNPTEVRRATNLRTVRSF